MTAAAGKQSRIRLYISLLVLCFSFVAAGPAGAITRDELASKLRAVLNAKALEKTTTSLTVIDLKTNEILLSVDGDKPLIPASNQKIATASCAIDILGGGYVFKTELYTSGPVGGGCLHGNLVVKGGGDPNISGRFHEGDAAAVFKKWAETLKAMGVRRITGDVVGDDSLFDRVGVHPSWPRKQLHRWYCAPSGALVLNDSCLDVITRPGASSGAPALCTKNPPTDYMKIENSCKTTTDPKLHRKFSLYRRPDGRTVSVGGFFLLGAEPQTENVTVDDPGMFFITVLKGTPEKKGIQVDGSARLIRSGEKLKKEISVAVHSTTLASTLAVMNKRSQNLYAEQLFKLAGAKKTGRGTYESGAAAVGEFLEKAGVKKKSFTIADGSGLSKDNRITTSAIATVLGKMFKGRNSYTFWASLSIGGIDGTLRRRFREKDIRGRVVAKSGYVVGVCSLSGYVVTPGNRYFAFSFITNDLAGSTRPVKKVQEQICRILLEEGDGLK